LKNGDRVEIYRTLLIEPREARRQLAEAGLTMKQGAGS
jgi:putative ubiquitin-RnfH superfamily antitoxin RatB of RatAB toxin-antitoxin module